MSAGLLDPPGTSAGGPRTEPASGESPEDAAPVRSQVRRLWRSARAPVVVLGLLVALSLVVLLAGQGRSGYLDPEATDPGGARALAVLLEDGGVDVDRVTRTEDALAGSDEATVLLPFPEQLVDRSLDALADSELDLVVVGPSDATLEALAPGVALRSATGASPRSPGCSLPAATTAGVVELGGLTYDAEAGEEPPSFSACYDATGGALLVAVERPSGATTTVLGSGDLLTNDRLDVEGNAALGLVLLGGGGEVRWLLPAPGAETPAEDEGLVSLLPGRVQLALLQLAVAGVLLALWQARRLGPVVAEPLPVVVRAAETVEGRARLYRSARARDRAAEQLRSATRARLATAVGAGTDPPADALVPAVALRAGVGESEIAGLLYGPVPPDDRSLVRVAGDLDRLESRLLPRARPAPDDGGRS